MTRGLGRHLSRTKAHRDALIRNMATQLLQHGTISSTTPKLKETQRFVERIITIAKHGVEKQDVQSSVPELQSRLYLAGDNSQLLKKLFNEIVPRYMTRNGGYTRVLKLEPRLGDRAAQGILELVDAPVQDAQGQLLKGNIKLWLLTKTCMQQIEVDQSVLHETTLKNLKKMTFSKSVDDLLHDIGTIRRQLVAQEQQNKEVEAEFNEAQHQAFLQSVKKQLEELTPQREQPSGYAFVERPLR